MKLAWQCLFSPRLYKIYREGPGDLLYQPQGPEKWGDKVITTANTIMNIGLYTSPFICLYIYKRGFFTFDETKALCCFFGGIGCLLALSFIMRAYGRSTNPKYIRFLTALKQPMTDKKAYLKEIRKYDFEYQAWPVTFKMPAKKRSAWMEMNPFNTTANSDLPAYQRVVIQMLAYVATHTFALRLIYPGTLSLLQLMLWGPLFQGRTLLVEGSDGQRTKLQTADGNIIDTMFVDQRPHSSKGHTLIVCCEGNSGFYEIGIMSTPVKAGFSAIGWNHPGFAESTGLPYPAQEHNAIDAVIQYAIQELGFEPEQIVMFGWSIGGYTATWAACNYPVKGLILDATFDDLLPLAENQMPSSWSLLVKEVVRSYVNLNIADMITSYDGPVRLVRRTEDEIICLRQGVISSNRGNFLLMKLIEHRHPTAVANLLDKVCLVKLVAMYDAQRLTLDRANNDQHKMLLPLIARYTRDLKATHCSPLPDDHFSDTMDKFEGYRR